MKDKIRVLIADDMEAHRRRLMRVIAQREDMECVGFADSGVMAVEQAEQSDPHVVLMDIEMENQYAGIQAAKKMNEDFPNIKIIMLTVHKDENFIFSAFQTGIVDYLLKTATNEEITDAIYSAYHNRSPIRPMIAEKIRGEFARIKRAESSLMYVIQIISELTPSELQVLRLLCEGRSRKQIADERSVEYETIKKQINSILKKFKLSSIADVIASVNELRIFEVLKKL
ncbi:response regulator transcription factor [Paenibacillus silviterrae]|uniref:response regulator transcription factor n=1 Tax=Paenibacillus silviterrae TaxID=3242194 RepID=UPI002543DEE2|nr:response regulator transcription factor [Paenibacillus chinjuensis]